MSENIEGTNGTAAPAEQKHEAREPKAKKAKAEKREQVKYVHMDLDTGDAAQFSRFKVAKEGDPHFDHRQNVEVPEALVRAMGERDLPTTVIVEEDGDDLLILDGRTRIAAVPQANRLRKKAGLPPVVLHLAVRPKIEDSIEGAQEVIKTSIMANVRKNSPPTVLAADLSQAMAADVTEEWIVSNVPEVTNSAKLHEYLALLDLPKAAQKYVDDGTISIKSALALTRLDEKDVEAAMEKLAAAAKLGKKVPAAAIAPKQGEDKVATKKEIKQFALNLEGDPFAGKHGDAVSRALVLAIELCMGTRSIPQATAAASRLAKGESVKIDFKQFQTDGKK